MSQTTITSAQGHADALENVYSRSCVLAVDNQNPNLAAHFSDTSEEWKNDSVLRVDIEGIVPDSGRTDPNYPDIGLSRRLFYGERPGDPTAPERFSDNHSVQDTVCSEGLNFFMLDSTDASARRRIVRLTLVMKPRPFHIDAPVVIFQGPIDRLGSMGLFNTGGILPAETTLGNYAAAAADVDTFVRRASRGPGLKNAAIVRNVLMDIILSRRFVEADSTFIAQRINEIFNERQIEHDGSLQITRDSLLERVKPGGEISPGALRKSTERRSNNRPVVYKLTVRWGRVRQLCKDALEDVMRRTIFRCEDSVMAVRNFTSAIAPVL